MRFRRPLGRRRGVPGKSADECGAGGAVSGGGGAVGDGCGAGVGVPPPGEVLDAVPGVVWGEPVGNWTKSEVGRRKWEVFEEGPNVKEGGSFLQKSRRSQRKTTKQGRTEGSEGSKGKTASFQWFSFQTGEVGSGNAEVGSFFKEEAERGGEAFFTEPSLRDRRSQRREGHEGEAAKAGSE